MPPRASCRFAALGAFSILAGALMAPCAPAQEATGAAPIRWMSSGLARHPLVGRIWRRDGNRFVSEADLMTAAKAAPLVLIGEIHDNPDHHRLQARLTAALLAERADRGVALEMIRSDQQDRLDMYLAARPGDLDGLGRALEWDKSGWPAWHHYAAVLAPFVARRLALRAANLPTAQIRAIARDGFAALGPGQVRALALDVPIPAAILGAMTKEIIEVHCGALPESRATAFARIQIARDAAMAAALRKAVALARGGAVLIAGNGHVRTDRGVPWHLARQGASGGMVAIAPMEVAAGHLNPEDYGEIYGAEPVPFDYLWFTPRHRREDPCTAFRRRRDG